jgi:hypothetical protein
MNNPNKEGASQPKPSELEMSDQQIDDYLVATIKWLGGEEFIMPQSITQKPQNTALNNPPAKSSKTAAETTPESSLRRRSSRNIPLALLLCFKTGNKRQLKKERDAELLYRRDCVISILVNCGSMF